MDLPVADGAIVIAGGAESGDLNDLRPVYDMRQTKTAPEGAVFNYA